jgi:hypothetical protein
MDLHPKQQAYRADQDMSFPASSFLARVVGALGAAAISGLALIAVSASGLTSAREFTTKKRRTRRFSPHFLRVFRFFVVKPFP